MDTTFPTTDEEAIRYVAECKAALAARPVVSRHFIATIGARTARSGEVVTASIDSQIDSLRIACVGDLVRYADGSESKITSGAGFAAMFFDKPLAIVGSHIENGDVITSSAQSSSEIVVYADAPQIPGFLEVGYIPPIVQAMK